MCTVCGLPTTHVATPGTLTLVLMLFSGSLAILWVYFVLTHAFVKQRIRRLVDYATTKLEQQERTKSKE